MNHACFCHGGCHSGYKLQFDFSKSTKVGTWLGSLRDRTRREGRKRWRRVSGRLGSPSTSAGHQLAIRALIAFECNVAENFIWARHEGASERDGVEGLRTEGAYSGEWIPLWLCLDFTDPQPGPPLAVPPRHICISTARPQMQSWHQARHDDRIFLRRCESWHYDSAMLEPET